MQVGRAPPPASAGLFQAVPGLRVARFTKFNRMPSEIGISDTHVIFGTYFDYKIIHCLFEIRILPGTLYFGNSTKTTTFKKKKKTKKALDFIIVTVFVENSLSKYKSLQGPGTWKCRDNLQTHRPGIQTSARPVS